MLHIRFYTDTIREKKKGVYRHNLLKSEFQIKYRKGEDFFFFEKFMSYLEDDYKQDSTFLKRCTRALEQKLFVLQWKEEKQSTHDFPTLIYTILGSTGNAYLVTFENFVAPQCNCPDFEKQCESKGREDNPPLCKHILFVCLRILKLSKKKMFRLQQFFFLDKYS